MSIINSVANDMNTFGTKMIWGTLVLIEKEYISPVEMTDASLGHKVLRASAVLLIIAVVAEIFFAAPILSICYAILFSAVWFAGELSPRATVPSNLQEVFSNGQQLVAEALQGVAQLVNNIENRNQPQIRQAQNENAQINSLLNKDFATLIGKGIKIMVYGNQEEQDAYKQQIQNERQQREAARAAQAQAQAQRQVQRQPQQVRR